MKGNVGTFEPRARSLSGGGRRELRRLLRLPGEGKREPSEFIEKGGGGQAIPGPFLGRRKKTLGKKKSI